MRSLILLLSILTLAACSRDIGEAQWATVTVVTERSGWDGCHTGVLTDQGMPLSRRGCTLAPGDRVCIQAVRRPNTPEPTYRWDPAIGCDPDHADPNPGGHDD